MIEDVHPPFTLSRPQVSRAHKFFEVLRECAAYHVKNSSDLASAWVELVDRVKHPDLAVVLIEHDWTAAVDLNPDDYKTDASAIEFRLPSANCLFEFTLNGTHVVWWRSRDLVVYSSKTGDGYFTTLFPYDGDPDSEHFGVNFCDPQNLNEPGSFINATNESRNALIKFLDRQVASACIVLDAEVAYKEVIRAPHKLNATRSKKGRLPLLSYHVIKLTKQKHALPAEKDAGASSRRHRMHFVRGHWRHFEQHKTWVKWHVRGNPDLGRIEKEYRL